MEDSSTQISSTPTPAPPPGSSVASSNIVSSFPLPPPFYTLYARTTDNLDQMVPGDVEETMFEPPEPPNPVEGTYTMFGKVYFTDGRFPSLEEEGRVQLYPKESTDHIYELKKLNQSLVSKFLELINFLIHNPEEYKTKVEEIELMMVNMHHLVNLYRPNQARQTLISMMDDQIARRQSTVDTLDESVRDVKEILARCLQLLDDSKLPTMDKLQVADSNKMKTVVTPMELERMDQVSKQDQLLQQMKARLDTIKM